MGTEHDHTVLRQALHQALADLADDSAGTVATSHTVAVRLELGGYRGPRDCPTKCPTARYLIDRLGSLLPDDLAVYVDDSHALVLPPGAGGSNLALEAVAAAPLPDAIHSFIYDFDIRELYGHLESDHSH